MLKSLCFEKLTTSLKKKMLFVAGMAVVVGKAVVAASSPYPILLVLPSGLWLERKASIVHWWEAVRPS